MPQDRLRPPTILTPKTVYAPPWSTGGAFCHRVTIRPTVFFLFYFILFFFIIVQFWRWKPTYNIKIFKYMETYRLSKIK